VRTSPSLSVAFMKTNGTPSTGKPVQKAPGAFPFRLGRSSNSSRLIWEKYEPTLGSTLWKMASHVDASCSESLKGRRGDRPAGSTARSQGRRVSTPNLSARRSRMRRAAGTTWVWIASWKLRQSAGV